MKYFEQTGGEILSNPDGTIKIVPPTYLQIETQSPEETEKLAEILANKGKVYKSLGNKKKSFKELPSLNSEKPVKDFSQKVSKICPPRQGVQNMNVLQDGYNNQDFYTLNDPKMRNVTEPQTRPEIESRRKFKELSGPTYEE